MEPGPQQVSHIVPKLLDQVQHSLSDQILTSKSNTCQHCDGVGWISTEDERGYLRGEPVSTARPCLCTLERTRQQVLGPRFARAHFEYLEANVIADGRVPHPTLVAARDMIAAQPRGSYFLYGDYGGWKTWLAAAQFNALLNEKYFGGPVFLDDRALFSSLRDLEFDRPAVVAPHDVTRQRISHLIVDDLGKQNVSAFVRSAYLDLIDAFHKQPKVGLTVTSNYSLLNLMNRADGQEFYDPGMVRRINEICTVMEIKRSEKAA